MADAPDRHAAPTASLRRRLASMLYEAFLLLGVLSIAFVLPNVLAGLIWKAALPGALLWLHLNLVLLAYFGWLWHRGGQTLAMQTWKIRLVSNGGGTPAWRTLVLRYVLAWPSLLLGGLGIVWSLFDRDRQFLHDRLSGTRLVKAET